MDRYRKVAEGLTEREVGDELVILKSDTGEVHQLNEVAACVWRNLEQDTAIAELAAHVTEQFAVDRATAEQDVVKLLDDLASLKLVEVVAG